MALDKSKPHGQIFGKTDDKARFVQDGVRYDGRGNEVGREPGYTPPTPKPAKPKAAAPIHVGRRSSLTMPHDRENLAARRAEEQTE